MTDPCATPLRTEAPWECSPLHTTLCDLPSRKILYPAAYWPSYAIILHLVCQAPVGHLIKGLGEIHDDDISLFACLEIFEDILSEGDELCFS